jgi:MFS family permease
VGMGAAFMPAMTLATSGIRPQDAGVASAMVNTSQQVGGSIGTALLNTIAAGATTGWIATHATGAVADPAEAAVHGYVTAFWSATAIMLLAALLVAVLVRTDDRRATGSPTEDADGPTVPVLAH